MKTPETISWKKNLFCIWLAQILSLAGFAGIMPFMPLFMREQFHITDERQLGIWIAAFTFCSMCSFSIATPVWGVLSDKYGRKVMLLRAHFAAGILFPLMYFMPSAGCLLALRGFCSFFTGTVTAAQTLIATGTPEEHHGFALGLLSSAMWTGNMIGFLVGAMVVNCFGFFGGFLVCGILYLIGGFLILFFVHENFHAPEKVKIKVPFREKMGHIFGMPFGLLLLLFCLMGLARRFDDPYISLIVSNVGGAEDAVLHTGYICAAAAFGGFLSGMFLGRLCDKYPAGKIATPFILLAAGTMIWQYCSASLWMLGIARFLHFSAAGLLEPAFQTMLSRMTTPETRGMYFGLSSSFRTFGVMLAAAFSGGVAGLFGVNAVFIGSCILFLMLLPLLYLIFKSTNYQT